MKTDKEKNDLLVRALEKDITMINQLCEMVNHCSVQLGLGKKVHPEDFLENAQNAIKNNN